MLNILDQAVINIVNKIHNPLLDGIMIFFTSLGDNGIIWGVLLVILLSKKKTRNTGIVLMISIAAVFVFSDYLKDSFHRVRPYEYMDFIPKIKTSGTSSFPSSHSAVAFAVFGIYCFYNLRYKYVTGIIALIISISRFYLGVHYFTDVLAGAVLGFAVSYILFCIHGIILKYVKINDFYLYKKFFVKEKR